MNLTEKELYSYKDIHGKACPALYSNAFWLKWEGNLQIRFACITLSFDPLVSTQDPCPTNMGVGRTANLVFLCCYTDLFRNVWNSNVSSENSRCYKHRRSYYSWAFFCLRPVSSVLFQKTGLQQSCHIWIKRPCIIMITGLAHGLYFHSFTVSVLCWIGSVKHFKAGHIWSVLEKSPNV